MPRIEYEDKDLWEKLYSVEETQKRAGLEENSWTEGEDGEEVFDSMVLRAVQGKDVIDVGCGLGEFTLEMATLARKVIGVDFSERAVAKAIENTRVKGIKNADFKLAEAHDLPYASESFDLAISRRGPATDSLKTAREIYRVLREGGQLMEITIGERDKLSWKEIFGRGQNYPFKERVAEEKRKLLAEVGFKKIDIQEFEATEYFECIKDVIMRLETTPIIPNFNKEIDEPYLVEIEKAFGTAKGIRTNKHRVLITATKQVRANRLQ